MVTELKFIGSCASIRWTPGGSERRSEILILMNLADQVVLEEN